jgi:transcriptional regulator with XRE-family HTH domain
VGTEIEKAKFMWSLKCRFDWENYFLPNHLLKAEFPKPPEKGWIRNFRESFMLSQGAIAAKLNISRQAYAKLELNEAKESISIESLKKMAEALDCELIYFVRPKSRQRVSSLIWKNVFPEALGRYQRRTRSQKIQPLILATIATNLMQETKIRRQYRWLRKSRSPKPAFQK